MAALVAAVLVGGLVFAGVAYALDRVTAGWGK
jgi:hypothetical protein